MSHNPTYDPEPGYNTYGGDRSGHSTPPRFHSNSTLPVSEPAPYTNMASYRQATTGPANYSDNSAGNGKSYRYATAEPIPEDDVESPVADSRQVQFTDLGTESKIPPKTSRSEGSDKKFLILALVAAVFALLFIIFLGLFIWKNSAAANVNEVGQPGDTGAAVDQVSNLSSSNFLTTAMTSIYSWITQAAMKKGATRALFQCYFCENVFFSSRYPLGGSKLSIV